MNFTNTLDTRLNVHLTLRLIREDHKLKQMHLNTYLIVLHLITIRQLNFLRDINFLPVMVQILIFHIIRAMRKHIFNKELPRDLTNYI